MAAALQGSDIRFGKRIPLREPLLHTLLNAASLLGSTFSRFISSVPSWLLDVVGMGIGFHHAFQVGWDFHFSSVVCPVPGGVFPPPGAGL